MNRSKIFLAGINHKVANLDEREQLQFTRDELFKVYRLILRESQVQECVIIVTCNRVEFYLVSDEAVDNQNLLVKIYRKIKKTDIRGILPQFYFQHSSTAVRHLCKVISGIDSMIVGEDQIQNQVKEAYSLACSVSAAGKLLHKLFHTAMRTGKRIRNETSISRGALSVSGAALNILNDKIDDFSDKTVLIIGINSMTEIAARQFHSKGVDKMIIANRTLAKAQALASGLGAKAISLDEIPENIETCDIILSCTGKPGYILSYADMPGIYDFRKDDNPVLVDLAIPRDIDPDFRKKAGLLLIDQDYIHGYIHRTENDRKEAISDAVKLIEEEVSSYMAWHRESTLDPIFETVTENVEKIREAEFQAILEKLPQEFDEKLLDVFSKKLTNRLTNTWIQNLRDWIHTMPGIDKQSE